MRSSNRIIDRLRAEKQRQMRGYFDLAVRFWVLGEYELSSSFFTDIAVYSRAFEGVDSDLFWYGIHLCNLYTEFRLSPCDHDFNAFCMFKAFEPFKGLDLSQSLVQEVA